MSLGAHSIGQLEQSMKEEPILKQHVVDAESCSRLENCQSLRHVLWLSVFHICASPDLVYGFCCSFYDV